MSRRVFCFRAVVVLPLALCSALHGQNSSTTALSATPTEVTPGLSVTLNATVQGEFGGPTPTGSVRFTYGNGTVFATQALTQGCAQFVQPTGGITPGVYTVTAAYSGDANYAPSTSQGIRITVDHFSTQTNVSVQPSPIVNGQPATLSATVTTASRWPASGTMAFFINGTGAATVPLRNGSATASSVVHGYAEGSYTVTAEYSGDYYNAPSTSAPVNATVSGATQLSFSITPVVAQVGSNVAFQVSISGDSGQVATGQVGFYLGAQLLAKAPVVNGAASLSVPTAGQQPGSYTVTAQYYGDANNAPSSSTAQVALDGTTTSFTIAPVGAAIPPCATMQFTVSPVASTAVTWYVNGVAGGSAATGTIDANGNYTAPTGANPLAVTITASEAANPYAFAAAAPVYVVVPGTVGASNNVQVAAYTIAAPPPGLVSVEFGLDTTYGRNTWQLPAPSGGGTVRMLVAGMMAPATYHMRADVDFGNGIVFHDADQTFVTAQVFKPVAATFTGGQGSQPGIEMVNNLGGKMQAFDLQGNMIWGFPLPPGGTYSDVDQPLKQMSNGDLLVQVSPDSAYAVDGETLAPNTPIGLYEIQLDGTIVKQLPLATLQAQLNASGYVDGLGNQITLTNMHHDVEINPVNNHWIVLSNTIRTLTGVTGTSGPTPILGDVVIDVDPNNNFVVDWVWNEFDHLDVNRHPMGIKDWTHTNAIVYSADDHNILVSSRHQSWVMKVNYQDGTGDGTLMWRFGYQGDFTLINANPPQDWAYSQHQPSFFTSNTTGVFGLTMFDNGDARVLNGPLTTCPNPLDPASECQYSRMPLFTVDETNMTATLDQVMPFENFSFYGGNAEVLPNGNFHADWCSTPDPVNQDGRGVVYEWSAGSNPQVVWSMTMPDNDTTYRSHRLGSLYRGVTWTQ